MTKLFIMLQQSTAGTVLEILLLLIVAGIIGYLTAYFYYKSVYTKKIDILEGEKTELKNHIETLFSEKNKLEQTIRNLESELEGLKKGK